MLSILLLISATISSAAPIAPVSKGLSLRDIAKAPPPSMQLPDEAQLTCESREVIDLAEVASRDVIVGLGRELRDWSDDGIIVQFEAPRTEGDDLILSYGVNTSYVDHVLRYREHVLRIPGGAKCQLTPTARQPLN